MHCVNVRQLKNNPSEALRNAAEGPVLVLKGDSPNAVILHLDLTSDPQGADVRLALGAALFASGSLSLGRAARVASVPVGQMVNHLARLGIPVAEEGGRADLETLDEWLASS